MFNYMMIKKKILFNVILYSVYSLKTKEIRVTILWKNIILIFETKIKVPPGFWLVSRFLFTCFFLSPFALSSCFYLP